MGTVGFCIVLRMDLHEEEKGDGNLCKKRLPSLQMNSNLSMNSWSYREFVKRRMEIALHRFNFPFFVVAFRFKYCLVLGNEGV